MSIPLYATSFLLLAVSITEVGLVSSMVGFLHIQKTKVRSYLIDWPNNAVQLAALPENLLVDQGHTTNGAAGYGFVLGLFGLFVAWKVSKTNGRSKLLLVQTIGVFLNVLLSLAALIYTFVVTHQTSGQTIDPSVAQAGTKYPEHDWTPENWYKALRKLPVDDKSLISTFNSHISTMEAWKWMLIPLFLVNLLAFGVAGFSLLKGNKTTRVDSERAEKRHSSDI